MSSPLIERFLFEVPVLDPLTYGGAATLLVLAALVACLVPMRRALRIDPVQALAQE